MDIVLRATVVFVFVYVLMRAIGRRELSQMQPFDLLLLVVSATSSPREHSSPTCR